MPSGCPLGCEGMITDPVYEGKSMQGMIDLVRKGYFPKGSKVLYAHLGGAPALNGYSLHVPQRLMSNARTVAPCRHQVRGASGLV